MAQDDELRAAFERQAQDSYGFKRSRKGNYVNGAVARDWKWFRLGHEHALASVDDAIKGAGFELRGGHQAGYFLVNMQEPHEMTPPPRVGELQPTGDTPMKWDDMTADQRYCTLNAMETYGGSFASHLALAWGRADSVNSAKLADTFPELIERYGPTSQFQTTTTAP